MKLKWKKLTVLLILVLTVNVTISALATELESRKLTIIQVDGTKAQIEKPNGSTINAKKGISLAQDNRVSTGKNSYVYIAADEDKTMKMDANTVIAIAKASPKALKVLLEQGQLFFNVDKPLAEDEELTFDAANTSMSIRGTSGWMKCGPNTLEFYLIEGTVIWTINGQPLVVNAGEKVLLRQNWGGGRPSPTTETDYQYESTTFYTWEELPDDALVSVMEHRELIDLSAIGLDTPEAIAQAEAKVEEILKRRAEQSQSSSSSKTTSSGRRHRESGSGSGTSAPSVSEPNPATPDSIPTQEPSISPSPEEPTESVPETKPSDDSSSDSTGGSSDSSDEKTDGAPEIVPDDDGTGTLPDGGSKDPTESEKDNSDGSSGVPSDPNNTTPSDEQSPASELSGLSEVPTRKPSLSGDTIGTPSQM